MRSNGRPFKRIYAVGRRLSRFGWWTCFPRSRRRRRRRCLGITHFSQQQKQIEALTATVQKVSDQLGISGSCTAVGYQPLVVRLHTASLRADWSWAIAVPAIQSVTPLLPD